MQCIVYGLGNTTIGKMLLALRQEAALGVTEVDGGCCMRQIFLKSMAQVIDELCPPLQPDIRINFFGRLIVQETLNRRGFLVTMRPEVFRRAWVPQSLT